MNQLGNMLPAVADMYATYCPLTDAEHFSDFDLSKLSAQTSDSGDLFIGQLGLYVCCSRHDRQRSPASMPALVYGVGKIVGGRAGKQVVGVDACWRVASVTGKNVAREIFPEGESEN